MTSHPNVLFIVSDRHNAKVMGCAGHPDVQTPHLDKMAREGVRFTNAITQNPICTPSRTSFLSGQYCHNHGYYGLSGPRPSDLPSLFGHFRQAGYTTAALGKIHCPEYWVEDDCDVFHETCGTSVGGRSPAYTAFLKSRHVEHLEDHGALPEFGARGTQSMEGRPSPLTFEESQEGWIAATAIGLMEEAAAAGRPFLVHCSLPRPHQCTSPCAEFWDLYEGVDLALPANADYAMEGKAPHLRRAAARWRTGDWTLFDPPDFESGRRRKLHGYLGAVSQVDAAVGRLLDFLRARGLDRDTLVVYTADHGDYACEHGVMEKAPGICSDAITRVPHVWWGPGRVGQGRQVEEIVELVDVSQSLCALAGLEPMSTSDGADLSGLLAGEGGAVHALGVTEFAWSKSVRCGPWRYVHYPREMFAAEYPEGFGELYHLGEDPWEMTNLYFDPAQRDTVEELRAALLDWIITTSRPVTVHGVSSGARASSADSGRRTRFRTALGADGRTRPAEIRAAAGGNYL